MQISQEPESVLTWMVDISVCRRWLASQEANQSKSITQLPIQGKTALDIAHVFFLFDSTLNVSKYQVLEGGKQFSLG